MKYPEQCYRIGNEFANGFTYGTDETKDTLIRLESSSLTSITAETLAELARENGEVIVMRFKSVTCRVKVWSDEHQDTFFQGLDIDVKPLDESLGSFFLRVAKERVYIK